MFLIVSCLIYILQIQNSSIGHGGTGAFLEILWIHCANTPPKKQKFGKLYILKFHDFNFANPPP